MGFQVTWPSLPKLPTLFSTEATREGYFSRCLSALDKTLRTGITLCYQSTFCPIASLLTSTLANWVQEACCEYDWYQILQERVSHYLKSVASRALPWVPNSCRPWAHFLLEPQRFPQTLGGALGLLITLSLGWEAFLSGVVFYACVTKIHEYGYRRQVDSSGRLSQAAFEGIDPILLPRLISLALGILKALYSQSFLPLLMHSASTASSTLITRYTRNLLDTPRVGSRRFEQQPNALTEQHEKRAILFVVSLQSQLLSERMAQFFLHLVIRYLSSVSSIEETPLSVPSTIELEVSQALHSQSYTWASFFNREAENTCQEMAEFQKISSPRI